MAEDGKGGAIDETTGRLRERFSTPEEEEALALETLGAARVAGLGPQVFFLFCWIVPSRVLLVDLEKSYILRCERELGAPTSCFDRHQRLDLKRRKVSVHYRPNLPIYDC